MNRSVYIILYLLVVLVSAVSQIILKKAAMKDKKGIYQYLNAPVIIAYSLFFFSSLLIVFLLKFIPLSLGVILETSGYVYIALMSVFLLKERLSRKKVFGILLIIGGVLISVLW